MGILRHLFFLSSALLLSGCIDDFSPDIEQTQVLCLNSLIEPDSLMKVSISRSRLFTDEISGDDTAVTDARISFSVNGNPVSPDYIPQEGDTILVSAYSPAYGSAEGKTVVPHTVGIKTLEWTTDSVEKWQSNFSGNENTIILKFSMKVKLSFHDPQNITNHYHLSFSGYDNHVVPDDIEDPGGWWVPVTPTDGVLNAGDFQYESEPIFAEHIGVIESVNGGDAYGFTFFTDRQINGKDYTLNLQFKDISFCIDSNSLDNDSLLDCGISLSLNSISIDYYNWAIYCWQRDNGIIGDFSDMGLGDPMWGYTNVSSGAGVVAARSSSTVKIDLHNFLKQILSNH